MTAKTINRSILTLAVLGSLVLLNLLGLQTFRRLDLTKDKQFSLSSATTTTLAALADPLTIRAYFTADLPPPYGAHARYVRDLLEEYYARSGGKVNYEFIDPVSSETEDDKEKKKDVKQDIFGRSVREQTSVERELAGLGIQPVQVRVNEGDKMEVKRAYMGIAVSYGGKQEAIPVVQDTDGLEYNLTTLIRKLANPSRAKVAVLTGHDGPDPNKEIGRALGLLRQLYDVSEIDLTTTKTIPPETTALLVVAPRTPLAAEEQQAIDQFVAQGGSAAFLLDAVKTSLSDLQTEDANHGLTELLKGYGVGIEPGLVLDAECATMNVARQQGFLRIQEPVRYPFIPQPKGLDPDHPLTRGLAAVVLPFVSPLTVTVPEGGQIAADVLVQSSAQSWVQSPPYDLNPLQRWTVDTIGQQGARNLMVALSGVVPSTAATATGAGEAKPARIVVAGGASFITDQFFSPGNEALLMNVMDWLAHDDALLAVRTRGLRAAPLRDVDDSTRQWIKYANILGVPFACIALGLVRWRWREARRTRVSL